MSVIEEYTTAIIENLPEWNYSGAQDNAQIQEEIRHFRDTTLQIDTSLNPDEQLQQLSDIIQKYVPDNHISIKDINGKNLRQPPFTHKRENLSTQELSNLGAKDVVPIQVQEGKDPWIIGTIPNTKTGIVSIPSFGGNIDEQTQARNQFIDTFFSQKEKNKWQNIIFDFRGNTGGDSEIIKEIAERMGNTSVKYADKSEKMNTQAAQKKKTECSSLRETLRECSHYRPISPTDKFLGSIYILQDEYNASATEGAIFMLSQLPKSTTIGENTSGTFAGGATTELPMSYGSLIIGTEYRERYNKSGKQIKEKEGMVPNIPCSSEKSFAKAINITSSQPTYLISKGKALE